MKSAKTIGASVAVLAFVAALDAAALAQGRLDAQYTASLAGIPIGKGHWVIDISDNQYTAAASGTTAGLLRVFSRSKGSGASRGTIAGGYLVPGSYAASIVSGKTEDIRMAMSGGNVKEFAVVPPSDPDPERIPLTEAHRRGVSDPMSATLMRVPGTVDPLSSVACQHTAHVFDGRMRYDLHLAYKRMDKVKAEKGYEGAVVVCAITFKPIAGYIPSRAAIKYLVDLKDAEVWLAPIAGTRVLVPFKFLIPTPIGMGMLEATQFIATPHPQRASAAPIKTQ